MPLTRGTRASLCSMSRTSSTRRSEASIENSTWHDFRHDYASRLVIAGVSLSAVAELLGHKGFGWWCAPPIVPPLSERGGHEAGHLQLERRGAERARKLAQASLLFSGARLPCRRRSFGCCPCSQRPSPSACTAGNCTTSECAGGWRNELEHSRKRGPNESMQMLSSPVHSASYGRPSVSISRMPRRSCMGDR
jgi:hypothetical protein